MAVDVSRVTVATVVDDRPPYTDEVVHLFSSLEVFGGVLRGARRRAYFINYASPDTEERLDDLGVDVRVVPEVAPDYRLANKLAMFSSEDGEDIDLLVAVDSDVVVAGDFSAYLDASVVQAKQPDGDLLTLEMWAQLFDHFGLALPRERHPTSLYPGWTHAYFNTGVLLVPGSVLRPLHDRWLHSIRAVIDALPSFPGVVAHLREKVPSVAVATSAELQHAYYAEQWAFSLALQALGIPYAVLPLALNFPTIYDHDQRPGEYVRERFLPHAVVPLLIHHHHNFERGLPRTGYAEPDRVIDQVNEALFTPRSAHRDALAHRSAARGRR